jgi:hypothetical protein
MVSPRSTEREMDRIRLRSVDVLRDAPGVDPTALRRMLTALHQICWSWRGAGR